MKTEALFVCVIALKEVWDAGNLSFQPSELSLWETVLGWLPPLPLGNGKPALRVKIKNGEHNSKSQFPLEKGPSVHEAHFGPFISFNFQRIH